MKTTPNKIPPWKLNFSWHGPEPGRGALPLNLPVVLGNWKEVFCDWAGEFVGNAGIVKPRPEFPRPCFPPTLALAEIHGEIRPCKTRLCGGNPSIACK